MAHGKKPDFSVSVSRKNGEKNFYTRIGSAWSVSKGGISIQFDAVPVDGKCVLFPIEEKSE